MRFRILFALILAFTTAAIATENDDSRLNPALPRGVSPEEIIQRFAAKEKEFKEARAQYTYRQDARVQTLEGGSVDGEYRMVVDITFNEQGKRVENVVLAPQNTLRRIGMTREDQDDIERLMPFVLTTDEIADYQIDYAGQQRVDELDTYVFEVRPRTIAKGRRYFEGRIWVDDRDFQIVKTYGKSVPDIRKGRGNENLFPRFTTWREQIDGKYWFPTYTRADDTLRFSDNDVRIRMIVKYSDYKRFGARIRITYEGQTLPKAPDQSK
jgi:outer membrane lipoprotein-sorting protein